MINYFDLLNGFWRHEKLVELTPHDKVVYLCIIDYCNRIGWSNPFRIDWEVVVNRSGVSKNTFYKSVKRLHELKFLKYTKGRINLAMKIELLKLTTDGNTTKKTDVKKENESKYKRL